MAPATIDPFAYCARDILTEYHQKNKELILVHPDPESNAPAHVPKIIEMLPDRHPIKEPALIIGGGMAGLYIAMMLESIKTVKIPFAIVEAKDHVGGAFCGISLLLVSRINHDLTGRMFTHSFNKGVKDYDYYVSIVFVVVHAVWN
jgi:hypothetical protein